MDLFSLFLFTHENNEIKSPTKIYDFTVNKNRPVELQSLVEAYGKKCCYFWFQSVWYVSKERICC